MTNEMHCGSCTNACLTGEECLGGICVTTPCEGLCAPATAVSVFGSEGYKVESFGTTAERCYEVQSYVPTEGAPSIVCWNFTSTKILTVNGVATICDDGAGVELTMATRAGGYCVQASMGDHPFAGFVLPFVTQH
jgi:hypothetical protein